MNIEQLPIGDILPYENNAKLHPKKQIEQIARSIEEFGFNQPIVVDQKNVVIAGHGRLEAAKLLSLVTVPVIRLDVSEEQARAYRLVDNALNESAWDIEIKSLEIGSLPSLDLGFYDLTLPSISVNNTETEETQGKGNGATKEIVLCYTAAQFDEVVAKLQDLREQMDCPDNSELLIKLIEFYEQFDGESDEPSL